MATKHIMTDWDMDRMTNNYVGATRCGIPVYIDLNQAPSGPALARSSTTTRRDGSGCKRCRSVYDASRMK